MNDSHRRMPNQPNASSDPRVFGQRRVDQATTVLWSPGDFERLLRYLPRAERDLIRSTLAHLDTQREHLRSAFEVNESQRISVLALAQMLIDQHNRQEHR